ncbi:DUF2066 domain-containing protein [Colwellia sp. 75C3]|uniref:DUF2066 domain-containing protein n=1 Tax=Colwellia sp. 75C3 TaxID=888425 RepID=UPI001E3823D6|nr:DUF2066 domain-containing protein [Colwellia sp. 75C3]
MLSASSTALEVNDLYQAKVVVDSQDRAQREQATKKALQGVFLKVGGKKSVLAHDVLKKAQKRASRYVSQYRYQRKDDQLSLIVSFNEDKVNQLFEEANLALWGSLRPQVLLWLIDEQGVSRSIVASDADSIIPSSVNDFSTQRGLPIIMPLMDLTDSTQVVLSDFWGYFPEQIQQASLRYFADTIVVMRVSDSSLVDVNENTVESNTLNDASCGLLCEQQELVIPKVLDWRVFTQGIRYTQKYQGVDKVSLINQGLSDITELIYQSYALLASAESDFVIEVKNVTSLTSDTQLFNFLTDLSAVKAVTLISAQGDVRQFKLDLIGSKASFLASLRLNNKLTQQFDGLLDDFSQTQQFNNPENVTVDLNNLNSDPALSETLDNSVTPSISNPDVHIDKITQETNPTVENSGTLNANSVDELTKNDPLQILTETITPPTIVPKMPVFYWEQG